MNFKMSVLCLLVACGGGVNSGDDDVDTSSRDPRCVSACPQTMPEYDGVGAICNAASREQCLDDCEARIAGVPTVCQNCLLENSCFDPGGCFGTDESGSCDETNCTITSSFGSCTYATNDMAARLACLQKTDPRREVSCTATFQATSKCATVCT